MKSNFVASVTWPRAALLSVLAAALLAIPSPSQSAHIATVTTVPGSTCPAVFDPFQVLNLNLELNDEDEFGTSNGISDWEEIKADSTLDLEFKANFWADGEEPIVVSVRRKSATPLFDPILNTVKVSLKIDINEFVKQDWHDLLKLSLENGDDHHVLAEVTAWYMHQASEQDFYGYAAGCAAWVTMTVYDLKNGTVDGPWVYGSVEQRDKQMLRNRHLFVKDQIVLYEQDGRGSVEFEEGDFNSTTFEALCFEPFESPSEAGACTNPIDTPDDPTLATLLPSQIDMQAMLTLCANEVLAMNYDGWCTHRKNTFYLDSEVDPVEFPDFANPGNLRLHFPWDLDAAFANVNSHIYGKAQGKSKISQRPMQEIVLNHPDFRAQFNDILLRLIDDGVVSGAEGPLSVNKLHTFLAQMEPVLSPLLQADGAFQAQVGGTVGDQFQTLRNYISARDAIVRSLIAEGRPPPRM